MRLYALSQRSGETGDARGKAMRDVYSVLEKKKFRIIWSMPKNCKKYFKILDLPYLVCFLLLRVWKKDYVFYVFPENHIKLRILKAIRPIKRYKIIGFINDINTFRYGDMESKNARLKMREEMELIGISSDVNTP